MRYHPIRQWWNWEATRQSWRPSWESNGHQCAFPETVGKHAAAHRELAQGAARVRCACGVLISLPDCTLAFVADCSTQRWDEHVGVHLASQAGNFNALSMLLLMWASDWLANTHSWDKSQSTRKYINIFRAILCRNTKQKIITKMHMWSLQRKTSMA